MIVAFIEYVIRMRSDVDCITDKRGFLMEKRCHKRVLCDHVSIWIGWWQPGTESSLIPLAANENVLRESFLSVCHYPN